MTRLIRVHLPDLCIRFALGYRSVSGRPNNTPNQPAEEVTDQNTTTPYQRADLWLH